MAQDRHILKTVHSRNLRAKSGESWVLEFRASTQLPHYQHAFVVKTNRSLENFALIVDRDGMRTPRGHSERRFSILFASGTVIEERDTLDDARELCEQRAPRE